MKRTRFIVIACFWVLGAVLVARGEEPEFFTGLKQDVLFARVGLEVRAGREVPAPALSAAGVTYYVQGPALRIHSFRIAVYTTRTAAEHSLKAVDDRASIGPTERPRFNDIGDARFVWANGEGSGTLVFLRENVLIDFGWAGENDRAFTLARRIDEVLRADREVAPRGKFSPTPEIVAAGVPEHGSKSARITIAPEFRGLRDRAALRIVVLDPHGFPLSETTAEGKSRPWISYRGLPPDLPPTTPGASETDLVRERKPEEDGRFILRIPDKTGPVKLTMIAATPDNVIVTKEFTVNVTE